MDRALTMFSFSPEDVERNFVSAEQLMRVCDQVWSADSRAQRGVDRAQPRAGSCIYCKVDHLLGLFDQLRRSRNRVVVVSSESDRPINRDFFQRCPAQIAHWFSTNIQARDRSLSALPLGLANSYCDLTLKAPLIATKSRPSENRFGWLYVNFRASSNPAIREPLMQHFRRLKGANWVTVREPTLGLTALLEEMTSHRFVLCPPGNGIDTHRLWEALYSRTIPVALAHPALDEFRDLPILFVEDFRKLTRDFLSAEYERIFCSPWNWQKLFLPWWRDRIRQQGERIDNGSPMLSRAQFLRQVTEARLSDLKQRILRRS